MYLRWSEARPVEMAPGLTRRTLGVGEKVLMAEFRVLAGTVVHVHSHPYEQAGYVVSGQMAFTYRRGGAGAWAGRRLRGARPGAPHGAPVSG